MADYISAYSGAAVDEAVSKILKIHHGTDSIEISSNIKIRNVKLSISEITPTKVIATARVDGTASNSSRVATSVYNYNGNWYAQLMYVGGEDNIYLSGTYYIDWIAIEECSTGSSESAGTVGFEIDDTLIMEDGVLGVNTDTSVSAAQDIPVTAKEVYKFANSAFHSVAIENSTLYFNQLNGSTKKVALPSTAIPKEVITETSNLVNKSLSRTDGRVLRFLVSSDAHQDNSNELITKGTAELGQAQGEILKLVGVDFVASLGDLAWGSDDNTVAEVTEQIKTYHKLTGDSVKGENLLYLEGNHDDANYSLEKYPDTPKLTASAINALLYSKNKGVTLDPEHPVDGYCYKDFEHLKVRVICLNTEQGDGDGGVVEGYQLKWFAETALDMSGKTDWQVLTLAHHPLDYGIASLFKDCMNILDAFVNGENFSYTTKTDGTAVSIDYSDKNCEYIGHFHGHAHAFSVVPMQKYDNGYVDIGAYEICVPNACYGRNNQYLGSTNERIARYSTEVTYSKEDKDGKRTAFNLVTICLDEKLIFADNYGAGVDRVISYGEPFATYSITRNLTNCSSSSTAETATQYNAHTETLTAESGYTMSGAEVSVTMGGEDITAMYSNGVLSIPSVTGDIVITVTAVEQAEAGYTNQLPISTDTDGSIYNSVGYKTNTYLSSGVPTVREDIVTTGFIPVPETDGYELGQVVLYFAGCELGATADTRFAFYQEDKTYIAQSYGSNCVTEVTDSNNDRLATLDDNGYLVALDLSEICHYYKEHEGKIPKYIRFSGKGIDSETIITVNEVIE